MDLLETLLKKIMSANPSLRQGVQDAKILETWELAVGPQLAKHARAVSMKNKTMLVEVVHPVWKQELHSNKQLALRRLNDKLNEVFATPTPAGETGKIWVEDLFFLSPSLSVNTNPTKSKPETK
jgi:hypothetical protein